MKKMARIHFCISDDMEILVEDVHDPNRPTDYLAKDGARNGAFGNKGRWWLLEMEYEEDGV